MDNHHQQQTQGVYQSSKTQGLTEDDFEQARKQSHILPITIGKRYILFLSSSEVSYDGYSIGELLIGRGHPWRFEITDSECVQPEDAITEVYRYFPSQPLKENSVILAPRACGSPLTCCR